MCGICGELHVKAGESANITMVEKMMKTLERRGPDFGSTYQDRNLAFGHRRLAIIDLSSHSNQPFIDDELQLALVFNGVIYNYRELRQELTGKGYHFTSDGDTETIIKAYHCWGEQCMQHFIGMFAFAIWDRRDRSLFLARDRLGIKPLYYTDANGVFRFSSNTDGLLAAGDVDTRIDKIALHYQFTLHGVVPAPHTILQGIRKLPPATWMKIEANGKRSESVYWKLNATRGNQTFSREEWNEQIHKKLLLSVKRRMLASDVPVGVLLSGGLDSSLIVGLLAELGQENLRTFSIGFEDIGFEKGSEFEYSDQIAEKFHTKHHKFIIPNEQVLTRLPEAVDCMAEPMLGQDAIAFYLLSEQVSKEVKVVMSGQGADEVFAGYFWYPRMQAAQGSSIERFAQHYFDRDHDEYLSSVMPAFHGEDYSRELLNARLQEPDADEFLDQVLRADVTMLIVDDPVKRVDNMTMAWGLEARVPFLDHELVELAARMPPVFKLYEEGKGPMKAISRGLLPDDVIDRKKGYFPMPALKYVRGDFLHFMQDILNSQVCRERGLFQRAYVEKMLKNPEQHLTRIQGSKLWHLALLEYWLQKHVDPIC